MKKVLPLLLLISFFCASCKIQPVVPTGVENVKFGTVDMMKGLVTADLGLKVNNPNDFAITVYGIDLEVSVAGVSLGKVSLADKFKIEKHTEAVYPVKANATLTDILGGIPKILAAISKKQSNVELKGSIKVGSGIFKHTFPVDVKQEKVDTK